MTKLWGWMIILLFFMNSGCSENSFSENPIKKTRIRRRPPVVDPEPPIPDPPVIVEGSVLVGIGQRDITPPAGVPLAGFARGNRRNIPWDFFNKFPYAYFLSPSEGKLDPIRSKAMIIQNKNGKRLLFVSLDLIGATQDLINDLLFAFNRLGFSEEEIFISATSTHSGPGTLSRNFAWQVIAMDRFKKKIYNWVISEIIQSVRDAAIEMKEANLFSTSKDIIGLQKNRHDKKGHFDPKARFLLAQAIDGDWMGGIVNFAVHGTHYGAENMYFSADFPGAIERELEFRMKGFNCLSENHQNESKTACLRNSKVVFLFVNGAEGDVTPYYEPNPGDIGIQIIEIEKMAQLFGDQFVPALFRNKPVIPSWKIWSSDVEVGTPSMHFEGCEDIGSALWGLMEHTGINLSLWMPSKTKIRALEIGDQVMVTWPGEPTTSVGIRLKGIIQKLSGRNDVWIMGLTNDYLAYFTMPEEWETPTYETCSSLYGSRGTGRILRKYYQLLRDNNRD